MVEDPELVTLIIRTMIARVIRAGFVLVHARVLIHLGCIVYLVGTLLTAREDMTDMIDGTEWIGSIIGETEMTEVMTGGGIWTMKTDITGLNRTLHLDGAMTETAMEEISIIVDALLPELGMTEVTVPDL